MPSALEFIHFLRGPSQGPASLGELSPHIASPSPENLTVVHTLAAIMRCTTSDIPSFIVL